MELQIETKTRNEIVDITESVRTLVEKKFKEGHKACLIYTPHTTCGILIQENYDPDVQDDIINFLNEKVPNVGFKHSEGNSDSHIKASLIGPSKVIPVSNKKLLLGRWQGIALADFDGPRTRTVRVVSLL